MTYEQSRENVYPVSASASPDENVINNSLIRIVYQPIVDHVRQTILGYEALSRPHMNGQPIDAAVFFQVAHACQRSSEVDVLAFTTASAIDMRSQHQPELLFVNARSSSVQDRSYVKQLESLVNKGACQPAKIVIELTDRMSCDSATLRSNLQDLRTLGFRIALDDKEARPSNILALLDLRPDFIKVDRSLIFEVSELSGLGKLVESGHCVIAKGIETEEDLRAVKNLGVRLSQGYYWARPVSLQPMLSLLAIIEKERTKLVAAFEEEEMMLTDATVVQKSQELDSLINLYERLKNGL